MTYNKRGFTADDDERLVQYVQQYKVLYDPSDRDYRNSVTKKNAWSKIGQQLMKNADICKLRWRDIRDNYTKILRKEKLPRYTATLPKWHLLDHLFFLGDLVRERPSFSYILEEATNPIKYEEDEPSQSAAIESSDPTSPEMDTTDNQSHREEELNKMEERQMALLETMAQRERDDDVDLFMKSIALSVKKLPRHLINKAKTDILACVTRLEDDAANLEPWGNQNVRFKTETDNI